MNGVSGMKADVWLAKESLTSDGLEVAGRMRLGIVNILACKSLLTSIDVTSVQALIATPAAADAAVCGSSCPLFCCAFILQSQQQHSQTRLPFA